MEIELLLVRHLQQVVVLVFIIGTVPLGLKQDPLFRVERQIVILVGGFILVKMEIPLLVLVR